MALRCWYAARWAHLQPARMSKGAWHFFWTYYRDHMLDHTAPYPGVAEALEKLDGQKMAVLTNKPVNFSREMLTRLGFASRFAYIYGGNSFPQKKPDPIGMHKLMEDLRISARETLMVGDSDTDVLTGRNAGRGRAESLTGSERTR